MKKNLSNYLTIEVLETIGLSKYPLSSTEIENDWSTTYKYNNNNSQIYPKIKEISGIDYHEIELISYNDFINNLNNGIYKLKLLKKIARIANIDIRLDSIGRNNNYNNSKINQCIKLHDDFNKNEKKGYLKIVFVEKSRYEFENIRIFVDLNLNEAYLSKSETDKINLYSQKGKVKKDIHNPDNFFLTFFKKNLSPPFLDYTLKESKQQEIKKIEKNRKLVPNEKTLKKKGYDFIFFGSTTQDEWREMDKNIEIIRRIKDNTANYRYSLNIRGFLLYLINIKSNIKDSYIQKVEKIIENLLCNKEVKRQFYFLNHPQSIDSIIGGKKNRIEILRQVAKEMESILDYSPMSEIIQESTMRYFNKINRIISQFPGFSCRSLGDEEYKKWLDYKTRILKSMIGYEKNMLSNIQKELKLTKNQSILLETK